MLLNTKNRKLIAARTAAATTLELPIELYARQSGNFEKNPIADWIYTKGTTPVDIIGGANDTSMTVTIEEINIYNRDTVAAGIQLYAVDEPIAANAIASGKTYQIASVGSTNFVAIGAAANTVGLLFVATGTGTGTGTAGTCFQTLDMILQVDDTLCYSINAGWRVLDVNGQTKMSMPGYALLAGSATQVFSVAPATAAAHAVQSSQISADNINYPIYAAPTAWTPNQGAGLTVVGAFTSSGTAIKIGKFVLVQGWVAGATSIALAANGILCSNLSISTTSGQYAGAALVSSNGFTTLLVTSGITIYASSTAISAAPRIDFTIIYISV